MPLSMVAALGFGILQAVAGAAADSTECPGIPLQVISESARDRVLVCDGAGRAVAFLRQHGLEIKHTIRVQLLASAIGNHPSHIGAYDVAAMSVSLLGYDQAVLQTAAHQPFDTPMDKPLYVSFAAHEVAHAIVHQNFMDTRAPQLGHEYVAYVTQIATMEAAARDSILQRYKLAAFAGVDDMSMTYYALNPSAFAVKAYRHYLALADRTAFLTGLLAGTIRRSGSRWEVW